MVSFSAPPLSEKLKPFSEIMDKSSPRPASARISWNGEIGGSLSLTRGFPVPDPPEPAFRGRGTLFAKNGACRNVSCIIVFQVFIPAKLALKERGPASPYFFRPFSVCSPPSVLEEWGRFDRPDPLRSERPTSVMIYTVHFMTLRDLLATPLSISPPNVSAVDPNSPRYCLHGIARTPPLAGTQPQRRSL
jgi:hypothetical protein